MSGENTPKSEIGKSFYQNWKSDPMNSPKAFGKLMMSIIIQRQRKKNLFLSLTEFFRSFVIKKEQKFKNLSNFERFLFH